MEKEIRTARPRGWSWLGRIALAFSMAVVGTNGVQAAEEIDDPSIAKSCANVVHVLGAPPGQPAYLAKMLGLVCLYEELRESNRRLPKIQVRLGQMVVYRDGLTIHKTIVNRTQKPVRVALVYETAWMLGHVFEDSEGTIWKIQQSREKYIDYQAATLDNTAVVEPGHSLDLLCVVW
jgi:hypothetical protein